MSQICVARGPPAWQPAAAQIEPSSRGYRLSADHALPSAAAGPRLHSPARCERPHVVVSRSREFVLEGNLAPAALVVRRT